MPALVLTTDGKETRYDLSRKTVVVGRSVECDVQISEERASRRHFQVEPTDRGWVLRDLDSSNGTALNGYGVSRVLLTHGDEIEVGGQVFRFETEGGSPSARGPRAPRPKPSSGPAWAGAVVAVIAVAVVADLLAVEASRSRERDIREVTARAAHAAFLSATREPDPEKAAALLEEHLRAHPNSPDAPQALARLAAWKSSKEVLDAVGADLADLEAAAPALAPAERRWRYEQVVRRWADSPEAIAAIRRRREALLPAAGPAEDARVLFQRRRREADAAVASGAFGRALDLWVAHAREIPPGARADALLAAEVRRVEESAAARAEDLLGRAAALRDDGKAEEGLALLREALPGLEGTGAARRVAARLGAGAGAAGTKAPAAVAAAEAAGFARKRALYLRARDAEQFVVLRDYPSAAAALRGVAAEAADAPDVKAEIEERAGWLERVAAALAAVRAAPGGWKGKPWPASFDAVPPEDLLAAMRAVGRKAEDRIPQAVFAYDQGLLKPAQELVCAALDADASRAEAERLFSRRSGIPIPEGGFVAEKGEVISRAEWKRRRNAEAIARVRERQASLVKRLGESSLVKGIDRLRAGRAALEKARAHALELIFDETRYFYPYQDRLAEYAPVQLEVDKRVQAVRDLWDDRARFRAKADAGTAQLFKDFDETVKQLKELGGEPGNLEKEVAAVRVYIDRDLDIRTFFTDPEDLARIEYDAGVMRENAGRKTVADDSERRQVEVTNEYRTMFGRRALLVQDLLVRSSRNHGDDMARGGFFSHFNEKLLNMRPGEKVPKQACGCSSDGLVPGCSHGPDARIRQVGYAFMGCSENIHMGAGDPEGAHRGWIRSSGHHRNILTSEWKEMGTGRAGKYWTQNFGLPQDPESAPPPSPPGERWDGPKDDGNTPGGR